jgi:hypothetical protein
MGGWGEIVFGSPAYEAPWVTLGDHLSHNIQTIDFGTSPPRIYGLFLGGQVRHIPLSLSLEGHKQPDTIPPRRTKCSRDWIRIRQLPLLWFTSPE